MPDLPVYIPSPIDRGSCGAWQAAVVVARSYPSARSSIETGRKPCQSELVARRGVVSTRCSPPVWEHEPPDKENRGTDLRIQRLTSCCAVLFLMFVPDLRAQDFELEGGDAIDTPYRWIEPGFRVGVYGGYLFANRGMLDMGPGPTPDIGARLRVRVSSPLSLEINTGYGLSPDLYVIDPRVDTYPTPIDTVGLNWIILQGGVQFSFTGARTWHAIQPYLVLGGGVIFGVNEERSPELAIPSGPFRFELGTQPVFDLGLGIERLFGQKVGLAAEIRDHLYRIQAPEGFFRPDILLKIAEEGAPTAESSDWINNFELSLTLWYYF